jgi:hypothetical protein
MDKLNKKTTVTNSDNTDSAIPPEKTDSAMSLRAMVKSKKASPFNDN